MRRNDSGKLWNQPKLRHDSRLLQFWLAQQSTQIAPTASRQVHSCLPSSRNPTNKAFLWERATVGQQHQPHKRSDPQQMDTHSHPQQRDPSWSFPSVAPAHSCPRDFRGNLARATQILLVKGVDPGQADDSPEYAATLHDAHLLAQRHLAGTPGSKSGLAYWQRFLVLSQKNLPSSPAPYSFFIRRVFFGRNLRSPLLVSVSSPLVSDVFTLRGFCDGNCFSLSSTSFTSVNINTYIVQQKRKLFKQIQGRNTNCSSTETTIVLSLPRKRSDTRTPSDDQWYESQWRQDRWRTNLKAQMW